MTVLPIFRSWSGYKDELVHCSLWLYKATGEQQYLEQADENDEDAGATWMSWDNKWPATYVSNTSQQQ